MSLFRSGMFKPALLLIVQARRSLWTAVELGEKFRLLEQILNDLAQKNAKAKK